MFREVNLLLLAALLPFAFMPGAAWAESPSPVLREAAKDSVAADSDRDEDSSAHIDAARHVAVTRAPVSPADTARRDSGVSAVRRSEHSSIQGATTEPEARGSVHARVIDIAGSIRSGVGRLPGGSLPAWIGAHLMQLAVLMLSIGVIAATVVFYQRHTEKNRFMTTTRLSIMDKEVQRACRYIETHFDDPELSAEKVCIELVTGEAFLGALFERDLGLTVEAFIEQVRINRARIFLNNNPEAGEDEVAEATGFRSTGAFLKTFEKVAGVPFRSYGEVQADSSEKRLG